MSYPFDSVMQNITVVRSQMDRETPIVDSTIVAGVVSDVLRVLSDHGDEAILLMVRREQSIGSQTVLAVANAAWLDTQGEFVFGSGNRDRAAMEAIKSAPRSWALVAMTQAMIWSTNIREAAQWYHALLASGVASTSGLMAPSETAYVFADGQSVPLSLRYGDLYRDLCLDLEREGRAVY